MTQLFRELKLFLIEIKKQDLAFIMACFYLIFSYLRPQAIYPALDILPWTQICILAGTGFQIINNKFKLQFGHFLILLFTLVIYISCIYSQYPEQSFKNLRVIFIWLAEVIFFTNCVRGKHQTKLVFIMFLLIIFKMSLFGAKTWVSRGFGFRDWGIAGPPGFFANSGEFSLLIGMYAMIAIGFLAGFKNKKWIYHLTTITAIMTVFGASSRGGQLALLIGLLYTAFIFKKIYLKHIFYGALLITIMLKIIPEEQMERFSEMGTDNTSLSRLKYWEAGIDMLQKNNLTGVGFYSFPLAYRDNYKISTPVEDEYLANRLEVSHNSFVEVASTLGYPGLLIYIGLIIHIYRLNKRTIKIFKTKNEPDNWLLTTAKGLNAALLTYIIGSLFMSIAFYPFIYLALMLSMVLNTATSEKVENRSKE